MSRRDRHNTYFPHDAMVSLVTVMSDGKAAEMAVSAAKACSAW